MTHEGRTKPEMREGVTVRQKEQQQDLVNKNM